MFSLAFALPALLTLRNDVALGMAGMMSALVLAMSAIGNISSGFLLRAGVPDLGEHRGRLCGVRHIRLRWVGGLAPGALYAAAPQAAPSPQAVPPTIGLVQQASNLGQFTGPLVLGLWAEHFGWRAAPAIVAPAALFGLAVAFMIRGATYRQAGIGRGQLEGKSK
jgi:hypothetical protein